MSYIPASRLHDNQCATSQTGVRHMRILVAIYIINNGTTFIPSSSPPSVINHVEIPHSCVNERCMHVIDSGWSHIDVAPACFSKRLGRSSSMILFGMEYWARINIRAFTSDPSIYLRIYHRLYHRLYFRIYHGWHVHDVARLSQGLARQGLEFIYVARFPACRQIIEFEPLAASLACAFS